MSIKQFVIAITASTLLSACATTTTSKIDTSRLSLVKENHAEITVSNIDYILDSYIILFQDHITLQSQDQIKQ